MSLRIHNVNHGNSRRIPGLEEADDLTSVPPNNPAPNPQVAPKKKKKKSSNRRVLQNQANARASESTDSVGTNSTEVGSLTSQGDNNNNNNNTPNQPTMPVIRPDLAERISEANNKLLIKPPPLIQTSLSSSPGIFRRRKDDPQYCVEYLPLIFQHFRETEMKYHPSMKYMNSQKEIAEKMRTVLIDWLVDVHQKFRMSRESMFLCVNLIDRFMSVVRVSRKRLQLIGCTCLFIASKYEEIYIPCLDDLVRVCAKTYTKDDFLKMEKLILHSLNYSLTIVTPNQLIPIMLESVNNLPNCSEYQKKMVNVVCEYVTELFLHDYESLQFAPSVTSASSILLACRIVFGDRFVWNDSFKYYIGYSVESMENCVGKLVNTLGEYMMNKDNKKISACVRKFCAFVEGQNAYQLCQSYLMKKKKNMKFQ